MLAVDPSMESERRRIAGHDVPSLERPEFIDLPQYTHRRIMNARDPHSVVSGFRVCTHVILPRVLGYFTYCGVAFVFSCSVRWACFNTRVPLLGVAVRRIVCAEPIERAAGLFMTVRVR